MVLKIPAPMTLMLHGLIVCQDTLALAPRASNEERSQQQPAALNLSFDSLSSATPETIHHCDYNPLQL